MAVPAHREHLGRVDAPGCAAGTENGRLPGRSIGTAADYLPPGGRGLPSGAMDEEGDHGVKCGDDLQPGVKRLPPGGRGVGYALCFDKLIHTERTGLCFVLPPILSAAGLYRLEKVSGLLQGGGAFPPVCAGDDFGWNKRIARNVKRPLADQVWIVSQEIIFFVYSPVNSELQMEKNSLVLNSPPLS